MGQKRTELCGETDNSAMTAGAFNTAEQQRVKSITDLINIEHTTQKKYVIFKHKNTLTKLDHM